MKRALDYEKMASYPLFAGLSAADIENFVNAPSVRVKMYAKGDILLCEGDESSEIGLLLAGSCVGETFSESGKRDFAARFFEGDVFGDVLAMSGKQKSPVSVSATAETKVLYIPFEKLFTADCVKSAFLIKNLAKLISDKYFALLFRANCLSKPTLREKILFFLHESRVFHGSDTFSVDFDRNELADFISADRSALSRELSRLKSEGMIDFYKNTFSLKNHETF